MLYFWACFISVGAVGLLRVYLDEGRDIGISDRGLLEFLGIIVSQIVPIIRFKIQEIIKGSLTRDFRLQVIFMNQCQQHRQ